MKLPLVFIASVLLTACAGIQLTDVASAITSGALTAVDVATIVTAVKANNSGQALSATSVLSDIDAAKTAANSTSLQSNATDFISQINAMIAKMQAAKASQAQIAAAVAATATSAQVQAAAIPVSGSAYVHPAGTGSYRLFVQN